MDRHMELRLKRIENDILAINLAREVGMSCSTLSNIETGQKQCSEATLDKIEAGIKRLSLEGMMPKPLARSFDCIKDIFKDYAKLIPSADMEIEIDPVYKFKASDFTCYGCIGTTNEFKEGGGRCDFAFDPYNIDGDCLMDK